MGRRACCAKEGLNSGAWLAREDAILTEYIKTHGVGKWRDLPKRAGLKRCSKSCRLRWLNYLRPDIKRGNILEDEQDLIIRLHNLLGNRWSLIAGRLPGRTDNEIKNYWNTNLRKKIRPQQPSEKNVNVENDKSASSNSEPHKVIKTKALRCTEVYITPPQEHMKAKSGDDMGGLQCIDSISSSFALPNFGLNIEELMSSLHDDNLLNLVDTNVNYCDDQVGSASHWLGEAMQDEWRQGDPLETDLVWPLCWINCERNGNKVEP